MMNLTGKRGKISGGQGLYFGNNFDENDLPDIMNHGSSSGAASSRAYEKDALGIRMQKQRQMTCPLLAYSSERPAQGIVVVHLHSKIPV